MAFEIIKVALFVAENMDDYVGIVDDRPPALAHSLSAAGHFAVLFFELFFEIFREGFNLR